MFRKGLIDTLTAWQEDDGVYSTLWAVHAQSSKTLDGFDIAT